LSYYFYIENPVEINQNYLVRSGIRDYTAWADSVFLVKEQIMNLKYMVLAEGNESDTPPTNNEELLD
jgi:hypothetical protein